MSTPHSPQHLLFKDAALRKGFEVEDLTDQFPFETLRITSSNHQEFILKGAVYQSLQSVFERIADNKQAAKNFFKEIGIPFPKGICRDKKSIEISEIDQLFTQYPEISLWVCKPTDSTHGNHVLIDQVDAEAIYRHIHSTSERYQSWLIEEQIPGEDIRIQVIGGKIAAACRREPAFVIGDGKRTVQELADERDAFIQTQNPINRLILNRESRRVLEEQDLKKKSIPKVGQKVRLKEVANMSKGGLAIDITDELHEQYHNWIERISQGFHMSIYAVDIMSTDHTKDPNTHAKILELNCRPHWLQHTFSEVKQHDIASLILDELFRP